MNKRTQTRRIKAKQQQKGPSSLRTYSLVFVCALMLVSGFFLAARQHFSSMDFGMKNSQLRKQVDDLEAEKRRLLLAREISLSPSEIKKAAKKTGLIEPSGNSNEIAQVVSTTKEKALPPPASNPKSDIKSVVIKTAAVSAAQMPAVATVARVTTVAKKDKIKSAKPRVVVD